MNPLSVGQYVNNHSKGKQELGLQVLLLCTSLSLVGNLCRLTWVMHNSHKTSTTHSYQCLLCFRRVADSGYDLNVRTDVDACDCVWGLNKQCERVCTEG